MSLFGRSRPPVLSHVVVLAMVFGFGAGIVGQLVADNYFDPFRDELLRQELLLGQQQTSVAELNRVRRFLGIEQDFQVDAAVQEVSPSLGGIYLQRPVGANALATAYTANELVATVSVVTSDGWLLTADPGVAINPDRHVVVYQGDVYPIESVVIDDATDVVLVKVQALNVPVVSFGNAVDLSPGQLVVTKNQSGQVRISTIQELQSTAATVANDYIRSTEVFSRFISVAEPFGKTFTGAPVLNLGGELIGVSMADGTVRPINQFRAATVQVLRTGDWNRPVLGVSYFDLADADIVDLPNMNEGALVIRTPSANSPAGQAGIQIDDVILRVNDDQLHAFFSLTDAVQQYQPGATLQLDVLRDNQRITVPVVLGSANL